MRTLLPLDASHERKTRAPRRRTRGGPRSRPWRRRARGSQAQRPSRARTWPLHRTHRHTNAQVSVTHGVSSRRPA
eukprot:1446656-Rhodomonas_salina.1